MGFFFFFPFCHLRLDLHLGIKYCFGGFCMFFFSGLGFLKRKRLFLVGVSCHAGRHKESRELERCLIIQFCNSTRKLLSYANSHMQGQHNFVVVVVILCFIKLT